MLEALPLIENLYLSQQQLFFIFAPSQKWKAIYFFARLPDNTAIHMREDFTCFLHLLLATETSAPLLFSCSMILNILHHNPFKII